MRNLADKVVLVTGGGSGIGKAMIERFSEEGSVVFVADCNCDAGKAVAAKVGGYFVEADVTDPSSVERMISYCAEHAGRLDVLINNAGVNSVPQSLHEGDLADWDKVISVDLSGVFYGMKYGIGQMLKQGGGGVVINTCSTAGIVAFRRMAGYNAAKAGVANMTRGAALEYGKDEIRVNAIAPSTVLTEGLKKLVQLHEKPQAKMAEFENVNPLTGIALPEDIAGAAAFLASDDAKFISGIVLPVDGAYTAQ